ncbi:hypothetical protein Anapl_00842 [Anas platyrhynchos]|uniref:Uncharacterized protein n=1 Tax=Anas platyrhynchos TaxID=8839 RepID=R0LX34_ANAPL|nr:hypothetical protein Anapl_00842 [Anas platyrhynchos]
MHRTHLPKAVEPLYFTRLIQKDFSRSEDLGPIFITADGTRYNGALSVLRGGGVGLEVLLELEGLRAKGLRVRDSFLCRRRGEQPSGAAASQQLPHPAQNLELGLFDRSFSCQAPSHLPLKPGSWVRPGGLWGSTKDSQSKALGFLTCILQVEIRVMELSTRGSKVCVGDAENSPHKSSGICSGGLVAAKQAVSKLLLIAIKIAELMWEELEMNIKQECSKASFVKCVMTGSSHAQLLRLISWLLASIGDTAPPHPAAECGQGEGPSSPSPVCQGGHRNPMRLQNGTWPKKLTIRPLLWIHLLSLSSLLAASAAEGRDVPVTPLCLRPLSLVAAPAASPSVRLAEEETGLTQEGERGISKAWELLNSYGLKDTVPAEFGAGAAHRREAHCCCRTLAVSLKAEGVNWLSDWPIHANKIRYIQSVDNTLSSCPEYKGIVQRMGTTEQFLEGGKAPRGALWNDFWGIKKALLCERQEVGSVGAPTGAHQGILCPQSAWKENTFTAVSKSTLSGYTTKIRGENRAITDDQVFLGDPLGLVVLPNPQWPQDGEVCRAFAPPALLD